jgi:hypothetical protein
MRGSVAARRRGEGDTPSRKPASPARARVRLLSHADLLAEMRRGDVWAWGEFAARFRPLLQEYATQTGIPRWEWSDCIENVLTDEAMRLTEDGVPVPDRLEGYLIQAVYHRRLSIKRAQQRRARHEWDAMEAERDEDIREEAGAVVLRLLCSQHALDESDRGRQEGLALAPGLARLTREILQRTRPDEQQILEWIGQRVTHRQIAVWLGIGYEAAAKRVWRLCGRLRTLVPELVTTFTPEERRDVDRYLRRALPSRPAGSPAERGRERGGVADSSGTEESES